MRFHEYGDTGKKTLLVMHGMLCDWRRFREIFKPLERDYRVIYPAMNGCYDDAPDFRSFADECAEIEQYVVEHHKSRLDAVVGVSQGATLMAMLVSHNVIAIDKAILFGAAAKSPTPKSRTRFLMGTSPTMRSASLRDTVTGRRCSGRPLTIWN